MDRGEVRPVRTGERHAHARLYDSVTFGDTPNRRIVVRAVQRVRNRSYEQLGRVARQHGVGVQVDDVLNELEPARITDDRAERITCTAAEKPVELCELPAFSLPSHPDVLLGIPKSRPMEQKKDILAGVPVLRVQALDTRGGGGENLVVSRPVLGWRIRKVAEDRELQIRISIR